ncbi:MAG: hypothetical protein ACKOQ8_04265 [Micrococcales bacterium]
MKKGAKHLISISAAALVAAMSVAPANAHVSIIPGVTASGSSTEAITAGKSGVLNFRVGHGCALEKETTNPATGTSLVGTKWGTKSLSVDIPVIAQGTGTTIPKPAFIPGWTSKVVKNSDSTFTVSWTASSKAFVLPDAPAGGAGGNQFFDFGISIKWAADATGKTVYFKAVQTCEVSLPGKPGKLDKKGKLVVAPIARSKFDIYNSWDVTDGSGKDTIADEIEHNTAPSVTVK